MQRSYSLDCIPPLRAARRLPRSTSFAHHQVREVPLCGSTCDIYRHGYYAPKWFYNTYNDDKYSWDNRWASMQSYYGSQTYPQNYDYYYPTYPHNLGILPSSWYLNYKSLKVNYPFSGYSPKYDAFGSVADAKASSHPYWHYGRMLGHEWLGNGVSSIHVNRRGVLNPDIMSLFYIPSRRQYPHYEMCSYYGGYDDPIRMVRPRRFYYSREGLTKSPDEFRGYTADPGLLERCWAK